MLQELTALFQQHTKDDVAYVTPYVFWHLGGIEDCSPEILKNCLMVAMYAGVEPEDPPEKKRQAIGDFYQKYPPNKELADELMRILLNPDFAKEDLTKALGSEIGTFNPQTRDPSTQVAGGAMAAFNAAKLLGKSQK